MRESRPFIEKIEASLQDRLARKTEQQEVAEAEAQANNERLAELSRVSASINLTVINDAIQVAQLLNKYGISPPESLTGDFYENLPQPTFRFERKPSQTTHRRVMQARARRQVWILTREHRTYTSKLIGRGEEINHNATEGIAMDKNGELHPYTKSGMSGYSRRRGDINPNEIAPPPEIVLDGRNTENQPIVTRWREIFAGLVAEV